MNPDVYLLVNALGTKTKQWVLVNAGNVYSRVFNQRDVAQAWARLLADHNPNVQAFTPEIIAKAQDAFIKELQDTMPTSPEELGCKGADHKGKGYEWCLGCHHLRYEGPVEKRTMRNGRLYRDNIHRWMCGKILREVTVARHLADR